MRIRKAAGSFVGHPLIIPLAAETQSELAVDKAMQWREWLILLITNLQFSQMRLQLKE